MFTAMMQQQEAAVYFITVYSANFYDDRIVDDCLQRGDRPGNLPPVHDIASRRHS